MNRLGGFGVRRRGYVAIGPGPVSLKGHQFGRLAGHGCVPGTGFMDPQRDFQTANPDAVAFAGISSTGVGSIGPGELRRQGRRE